MKKIHMIPPAASARYTLCGILAVKGGRLAVSTRKEFNALSDDEVCLRCDTLLNGRVHTAVRRKLGIREPDLFDR